MLFNYRIAGYLTRCIRLFAYTKWYYFTNRIPLLSEYFYYIITYFPSVNCHEAKDIVGLNDFLLNSKYTTIIID